MNKKLHLTSEEREFFSIVRQAVFANPFSDERKGIDLKIAGLFPDISRAVLFDKTIEEIRERIRQLEAGGRGDYTQFTGQDRDMVRIAIIFDFFHYFSNLFDQLIKDQIEVGDSSVKVGFIDEAFSYLKKKGFRQKETLHYFALCYQLRRAYYFIDQNLIGRSPCMKKFRESLWNNVFTDDLELYYQYLLNRMEDFSTLILGETGTGKGAAANAIGQSGFIPFDEKQRSFTESFTRSFTAINLSEFSKNLIESELFGHKKGAFTGAVDNHMGVLSHCSPYGAVFLDEIGNISVPIQIKLLKVLEERAFRPVGSHETFRFKGRIIAATNRSMEQIQDPDIMRRDFFYRLSSDIITIPPLRQRIREEPAELDDLLAYKVKQTLGKPSAKVTRAIRKIIISQLGRHYEWPGNVRELEQYVRRILLNHNFKIYRQESSGNTRSKLAEAMDQGRISALDLIRGYCSALYQQYGNYGEVSRRTSLDRRTVKKYIDEWQK